MLSEGTSQSVANTLIDWVIHRSACNVNSANFVSNILHTEAFQMLREPL